MTIKYSKIIQVNGTHHGAGCSSIATGLAMMAANRGLSVIYHYEPGEADRVAAYFGISEIIRGKAIPLVMPIPIADQSLTTYGFKTGSIAFGEWVRPGDIWLGDGDCDLYIVDGPSLTYPDTRIPQITSHPAAIRVLAMTFDEFSQSRAETAGDYDFGVISTDWTGRDTPEKVQAVAQRLRWSGAEFRAIAEPILSTVSQGTLRRWDFLARSDFEQLCSDIVDAGMAVQITDQNVL